MLDLDTTTIGSFLPFQTGYLTAAKDNPARRVIEAPDDSWDYIHWTKPLRAIGVWL
jgi:hypothetical protein